MKTWFTTGQHPWVKFVELFLVANAVAAVLSLGLAPGSEDWFTWTIVPDASARLLAVMYANAVVLGVIALRQPDWAHARAIFVLITVFAVAATTMTFFHLDPFLAHPWYHLAYWLGGYAVLVATAPAILVWQERRHGGRLPVTRPMTPVQRATGAVAAVAMTAAAAALLVDPAGFSAAWPWEIAPLTGRLLGVWLAAFAAAYAWALWDGDWARARPLYLAAPITGLLMALVPPLHAGGMETGGPLTVYYALAAAIALPGLGLLPARAAAVTGDPARATNPGVRAGLLAIAAVISLLGLSLYVLPAETDRFFAWTIATPLTAAYLGASYWASTTLAVACAAERDWARARAFAAPYLIAGDRAAGGDVHPPRPVPHGRPHGLGVAGAVRDLPAGDGLPARPPDARAGRGAAAKRADARPRHRAARRAGGRDGRAGDGARARPARRRRAVAVAAAAAGRAGRRRDGARAGRAPADGVPRARLGPRAAGDDPVRRARRAPPGRARALLGHAGLGHGRRVAVPGVPGAGARDRALRREPGTGGAAPRARPAAARTGGLSAGRHNEPAMGADPARIALSEVVAGLSHALDLTEGEPAGHARRTCVIGMRLAEELQLDAETRSDLFYALLLKDAGCSANSARMAALFGADDHKAKHTSKRVDWARRFPAFLWSLRTVAPGGSARDRAGRLKAIKDDGQVTRSLMQARCDRGAEIARLLGFSAGTAEAIRTLDEHWDGEGQPRGLAGAAIPLLGRILCLAQTAEIFHAAGGAEAACDVAGRRSGSWFDPVLARLLRTLRGDRAFWSAVLAGDVSAWEPAERVLTADEERLDRIAQAFASVIDAKSPWTYHHSDRACLIATSLAADLGANSDTLRALRRAALLHDIGKLGISNRILDKPGRLTAAEYAKVREHPAVTERILAGIPGLRGLAPMAAAHHERLDGAGYPYGLGADELTMPMRVLAVADVYEALTSVRPYRRAMSSDEALATMRPDVPSRLDGDAFSALERLVAAAPPRIVVSGAPGAVGEPAAVRGG